MKKLLTLIIGLAVTLSSMHYVPANAMDGEMSAMSHCSLCSEEDRATGHCKFPDKRDNTSAKSSSPDDDCRCDFNPNENNHHTGIAKSQTRQPEDKMFLSAGLQSYFELPDVEKTFLFSKTINAPPDQYLQNLVTIQQLK